MRKIIIAMLLVMMTIYAEAKNKELLKVSSGDNNIVMITNGKSNCDISFGYVPTDYETSCKEITNSKGTTIFCTKDKRICKTIGEVTFFLYTGRNIPSNLHQKIPFVGKRIFNFYGGSGTGNYVEISKNGIVKFVSGGRSRSTVDYKGDINGRSNPYWIRGNIICEKNGNVLGMCTEMNTL